MKAARAGAIVNISSIGAHRGYANQIAYSTTKWAVRGMTKCAAVELAPYCVPGQRRRTRVHQHHDDRRAAHQDRIDAVTAATPLGRRGSAAEIAQAVLFLASAHCPFIAGAELVVDGGLSL